MYKMTMDWFLHTCNNAQYMYNNNLTESESSTSATGVPIVKYVSLLAMQ